MQLRYYYIMIENIFTDVRLFLLALSGCLLLFFLIGLVMGRSIQQLKDMAMIRRERSDAVRRSRAVLGGQFGEQLAPFLPGFPCNPGDVRFIGKPVDYIAFPGSAEGRQIKDIVFIEVKSGESRLSEREREIRHAVKAGRVHFVEYRLPD